VPGVWGDNRGDGSRDRPSSERWWMGSADLARADDGEAVQQLDGGHRRVAQRGRLTSRRPRRRLRCRPGASRERDRPGKLRDGSLDGPADVRSSREGRTVCPHRQHPAALNRLTESVLSGWPRAGWWRFPNSAWYRRDGSCRPMSAISPKGWARDGQGLPPHFATFVLSRSPGP
jgi:hypothetical protein